MLDQNTDRMWFVIGAVIVGAAIIFIANGTIPELFASVSKSFDDTAQQATGVVDGIVPLSNTDGRTGTNVFDVDEWVASGLSENNSDVWQGSLQLKPNTMYKTTTNIPKAPYHRYDSIENVMVFPSSDYSFWGRNGASDGASYTTSTDADGLLYVGVREPFDEYIQNGSNRYWIHITEVKEESES